MNYIIEKTYDHYASGELSPDEYYGKLSQVEEYYDDYCDSNDYEHQQAAAEML